MKNIFKVYYLNNNEWVDITSDCDLPLLHKDALDETLDQATLNLTFIEKAEPFAPFTKFKIEIEDEENETIETLYKVLDRDMITRETSTLYSHALHLIEPTKILERIILGGKSFTNRLRNTIVPIYTQTSGTGTPFRKAYGEIILEGYTEPFILDSNVLIHAPREIAGITKNNGILGYEYWTADSIVITVDKPDATSGTVTGGSHYLIDLLSSDYSDAPYIIRYTLNYTYRNVPLIGSPFISTGSEKWEYISVSNNEQDLQDSRLTIGKIIKRLLKSKQTLKVDNQNEIVEYGLANTVSKMSQQYYLDEDEFERLDKILAPEIRVQNKTSLWEALVQAANNVPALPRLTQNLTDDRKFDRIILEPLNKNEVFTGELEVTAETQDYSSDMYATSVDMVAENILNTNDTEQGSIVEPYQTGYKTTRAEDTRIVVQDDTAIITVDRPIYRIVKLEMGFINATDKMEDITEFIYEETEYNRLTSVDKIFPNSKAYALYYQMGDTKIQGLTFRNEPAKGDILGLQAPSIENIIKHRYPVASIPKYKDMAFRVTYIPQDTMRIEALHPDFLFLVNTGSETASTIAENQTENIVDSEEMGNKLKGIIARLSNPQKSITAFVEKKTDLPTIGQKYKGFYVTAITREIHDNYIQATVDLNKNFNRISEYVGLESERRFFEVSERQAIERMINIPLVVSVGRADFNYVPEFTNTGINAIRDLLIGNYTYRQATSVISTTKEEYVEEVAKEIAKTLHPVSSLSAGNSLVFNFKYKDNYSAGFTVLDYDANKGTQEYVPYANKFGAFKLLDIKISQSINEQDTFDKQKDFGKAFPLVPAGYTLTPVNTFLSLEDYWVDKDGGEALNITVQVHFVANEREVVVGNGLAKFNNMVYNGERTLAMVFLDKEVNVIDRFINIENQYVLENLPSISTITSTGPYRRFRILPETVPFVEDKVFKAWAIIDAQTNELIIARNEEISADGENQTTTTYFNF